MDIYHIISYYIILYYIILYYIICICIILHILCYMLELYKERTIGMMQRREGPHNIQVSNNVIN